MFYGVPCIILYYIYLHKSQKRRNWISFLRFVALVKSRKRTNDRTPKQNFISSFVRFVALYKLPKWRNGISFLRLFILLPSLKHDRMTKRQRYRKISKFDLSWLLVRFVVCSTSTRHQMTERQHDKMRFCILSRYSCRQNQEMKFQFGDCSFCRLPKGAKTNKRNGRIQLPYKCVALPI